MSLIYLEHLSKRLTPPYSSFFLQFFSYKGNWQSRILETQIYTCNKLYCTYNRVSDSSFAEETGKTGFDVNGPNFSFPDFGMEGKLHDLIQDTHAQIVWMRSMYSTTYHRHISHTNANIPIISKGINCLIWWETLKSKTNIGIVSITKYY